MTRPIDIVRKIAPRARAAYMAAFEQGDGLFLAHNITTPRRLAEFLAQIMVESGALTLTRESGNYRAARILQVFGSRHSAKVTSREAERLAGDGPALFERVYGLGNPDMAKRLGNTQPGDGWRYRGNGLMQTTGRYNHRVTGQKIGVDFEGHPELVTSAAHALKPALHEWSHHKLNDYADKGDTLSISRAINLGNPKSKATPNGAAERAAYAKKILALIDKVDLAPLPGAAIPVEPDRPNPPIPPKTNIPAKEGGSATAAAGAGYAAHHAGLPWWAVALAIGAAGIVAYLAIRRFTKKDA